MYNFLPSYPRNSLHQSCHVPCTAFLWVRSSFAHSVPTVPQVRYAHFLSRVSTCRKVRKTRFFDWNASYLEGFPFGSKFGTQSEKLRSTGQRCWMFQKLPSLRNRSSRPISFHQTLDVKPAHGHKVKQRELCMIRVDLTQEPCCPRRREWRGRLDTDACAFVLCICARGSGAPAVN